jgi:2-polyprenyl-3-methyl-5-hydroxy-6-metoxy-1,4-benzoquinol methylase
MAEHATEIARGERFGFGENWRRFLADLTEERIDSATASLQTLLGMTRMDGLRFLDVGSGSGLMSLAACRLGARVHSFDFDPQSVACTRDLKRRYAPPHAEWTVQEGSVLDGEFVRRLGVFDVVYSWGVLHHTGAMWDAFDNVIPAVAPGGKLAVAIYNDQRAISRYWAAVKRLYNTGTAGRALMVGVHAPYLLGVRYIVRAVTRRGQERRGMLLWHDMIDWLGGHPFEVARPEEVFRFFRNRGFVLREMTTCGSRMGCNEYVFELPRGGR